MSGVTDVIGGVDIDFHGRPSCVVLDDNTVAMMYVSRSGHATLPSFLHIKFSGDYGETWTDRDTTLSDNPVTGLDSEGEPYMFKGLNDRLILMMGYWDDLTIGTYQSISNDGGETWSVPAAINISGIAGTLRWLHLLDDSFVYDGTIYLSGRISTNVGETDSKSILVKSTDNGATWEYVSDISSAGISNEVGIEYLGSNRIIAIMRARTKRDTYRAFSDNMGLTWSAVESVYNPKLYAGGKHRIMTRKHLERQANWWDDSQLAMNGFVFVGNGEGNRRNCLWYSADGGITWSPPRWADDTTQDAGYGHIFWNPNTSQIVYMNYQGTSTEADLKQYNLSVDWEHMGI